MSINREIYWKTPIQGDVFKKTYADMERETIERKPLTTMKLPDRNEQHKYSFYDLSNVGLCMKSTGSVKYLTKSPRHLFEKSLMHEWFDHDKSNDVTSVVLIHRNRYFRPTIITAMLEIVSSFAGTNAHIMIIPNASSISPDFYSFKKILMIDEKNSIYYGLNGKDITSTNYVMSGSAKLNNVKKYRYEYSDSNECRFYRTAKTCHINNLMFCNIVDLMKNGPSDCDKLVVNYSKNIMVMSNNHGKVWSNCNVILMTVPLEFDNEMMLKKYLNNTYPKHKIVKCSDDSVRNIDLKTKVILRTSDPKYCKNLVKTKKASLFNKIDRSLIRAVHVEKCMGAINSIVECKKYKSITTENVVRKKDTIYGHHEEVLDSVPNVVHYIGTDDILGTVHAIMNNQ